MRNEKFDRTNACEATGQGGDVVTITCRDNGQTGRVQLDALEPDDEQARDRISRAEIRQSSGTIVVSMPSAGPAGMTRGSGSVGISASVVSGAVVSGGRIQTGGESDSGAVRVMLTLPEHADVQASTFSGAIDVHETAGQASVSTTSGRIHVAEASTVQARTTSGDIYVGEARSGSVSSTSGRLTVAAPEGHLDASTVSGDITARGNVSGRSTSGTVRVR